MVYFMPLFCTAGNEYFAAQALQQIRYVVLLFLSMPGYEALVVAHAGAFATGKHKAAQFRIMLHV